MNEIQPPSRRKKIIINVALLFMLIVFPALSWLYLNSGANFYRGMMADLGDYGPIPEFVYQNSNGDTITQKKFDKKLSVINFGAFDDAQGTYKSMRYVYDQFEDNTDVMFMTLDDIPSDSVSFGSKILEKGIDSNRWSFLYGDSTSVAELKATHFLMPDSLQQIVGDINESLILVDTNNVIRNYFLASDSVQLNRMITIMSVLMPRGEETEIKFEREKEK